MNWDAVIAISSAAGTIVIAVTGLLALRQLQELRRTQSFEGTEKLFEAWEAPEMREARLYVLDMLPQRLHDDAFRASLLREGIRAELAQHPELLVLRYFERVGAYVFHRLLVGPAIYEHIAVFLVRAWPQLREVAELMRRAEDNPYMFDKAQMLYDEAVRQAHLQFQQFPRQRPSTGETFTAEHLRKPQRPL